MLNNKGFAITGILYSVFVLFLMILLSVLSGFNSKRKILEKNIDNIKNDIEEKCVDYIHEEHDSSGIVTSVVDESIIIDGNYVAEYTGKYVISTNHTGSGTNTNYTYVVYLRKGESYTAIQERIIRICSTDFN